MANKIVSAKDRNEFTFDPLGNRGRKINIVTGIQGVAAGQAGQIKMETNRRFHDTVLLCKAVNYTGGTGLATKKITGAGNDNATVTPTIVNGVVTAVAVVAGGTGYVTGDTITIVDATGTGFVGTVTAAAGAVTAVAVTVGGTASPIDPSVFFDTIQLQVGQAFPWQLTPRQIIMLSQGVGKFPQLGELPLDFTEPSRNWIPENDTTSWDLFGVGSFNILYKVSATVVQPSLEAIESFDLLRNGFQIGGGKVRLFDNPIKRISQSLDLAAGQTKINNLTVFGALQRVWLIGATPGQLTALEVWNAGDKVLEGSVTSINREYEKYGFQFGKANFINANYSTSNTLKGQYNPLNYFDTAYISDYDGRPSDRLKIGGALILNITSTIAQKCTAIIECAPGKWI